MSKTMVVLPRISEKAYALSHNSQYVFRVPKAASKQAVAKAIEAQFDVSVISVNMTNIAGKAKRTYRKRGRAVAGHDTAVQKAYVRLKSGDSIPIFAAEEAEAAKQEEATKKAEKKAAKESK